MAVLVMDTACETCAVAVGQSGQDGTLELLAATAIRVPRSHSRRLQPAIDEVLGHAGLTVADIESIGVGVGPGSYTGVRIAVSTAKTMAYALGIPLHPISTLAALAATAAPQEVRADERVLVLPLLYARRGRAFGAMYAKTTSGWQTVAEPMVLQVAEWRARFAEAAASLRIVIHDFIPRYGLADELAQMQADVWIRLADAAGNFGRGLLSAFTDTPPVTGAAVHGVEPVYLLQTEAEAKLAGGTEG